MSETQLRKLHLRTTGGMGISLEGTIDLEALPRDTARDVESELTPTKLSRVARRKMTAFAPGQQEYEVTLFTGVRAEPRRYTFTDQQADPELLDLMDELTSIIIRQKMQARQAAKVQEDPVALAVERTPAGDEQASGQSPRFSGPTEAQADAPGPGEEAGLDRDGIDAAPEEA